jgi:hypothetical protein
MAIAESQGPGSIQGLPNLYRATLVVSLLVLILLPIAVLNVGVWLESRGRQLEGNRAALDAETKSLTQAVAAGDREMAALDARVIAAGRAQQLLDKEVDPNVIWGPDSRWSDMGKTRVLELWGRREALQRRVSDTQIRVYEKTAEVARIRAAQEQNDYLTQAVTRYRFLLKGLIVVGVVLSLLSLLGWQLLIQRHVNALLRRWTD